MERFREQKKDLHLVFIDLEKAYDKILRNVMWWSLDKHKVPTKYVTLIKDMYNNAVTSVRTNDGNIDYFLIKIGLHQGSTLSLYLFALVMDEVTRNIQGGISHTILLVLASNHTKLFSTYKHGWASSHLQNREVAQHTQVH